MRTNISNKLCTECHRWHLGSNDCTIGNSELNINLCGRGQCLRYRPPCRAVSFHLIICSHEELRQLALLIQDLHNIVACSKCSTKQDLSGSLENRGGSGPLNLDKYCGQIQ